MSKLRKFFGLPDKATPKESVSEENIMIAVENQIRSKMENLTHTIQKAHNEEGTLTNKQIIDLVVAIDPLIADLGELLSGLDPKKDTSTIGEARAVCDENKYLRDVLMSKIKEFH